MIPASGIKNEGCEEGWRCRYGSTSGYTDKKEHEIFHIYKKIQMGSVAKCKVE
jgi:hypothetical protein